MKIKANLLPKKHCNEHKYVKMGCGKFAIGSTRTAQRGGLFNIWITIRGHSFIKIKLSESESRHTYYPKNTVTNISTWKRVCGRFAMGSTRRAQRGGRFNIWIMITGHSNIKKMFRQSISRHTYYPKNTVTNISTLKRGVASLQLRSTRTRRPFQHSKYDHRTFLH